MTKKAQLALTALLLAAAGCQDRTGITAYTDRRIANESMVNAVFEDQQRAAIATDRTVYPHHFELSRPDLNELGQQHVQVLAESIPRGPITISVARGDVDPKLYEQRVQAVMAVLSTHGMDTREVVITEDLPAGPGTTATRAVAALQPYAPAPSPTAQPVYIPPMGGSPYGDNP